MSTASAVPFRAERPCRRGASARPAETSRRKRRVMLLSLPGFGRSRSRKLACATTIGLLAAVSSAVITLVAPASASAACPESTLCLYQNAYFSGKVWDYPYSLYPHEQWFYVGTEENDETSSFVNQRQHSTLFAQNTKGGGYQACSTPYGFRENLGELKWPGSLVTPANDSISSIYFTGYETTCTSPGTFECLCEEEDVKTGTGEGKAQPTGPVPTKPEQ
jgi:hypothetical protein